MPCKLAGTTRLVEERTAGALQLVEGHGGGRPEERGGAADHGVVDAAALQVRHRIVQRHERRRARWPPAERMLVCKEEPAGSGSNAPGTACGHGCDKLLKNKKLAATLCNSCPCQWHTQTPWGWQGHALRVWKIETRYHCTACVKGGKRDDTRVHSLRWPLEVEEEAQPVGEHGERAPRLLVAGDLLNVAQPLRVQLGAAAAHIHAHLTPWTPSWTSAQGMQPRAGLIQHTRGMCGKLAVTRGYIACVELLCYQLRCPSHVHVLLRQGRAPARYPAAQGG